MPFTRRRILMAMAAAPLSLIFTGVRPARALSPKERFDYLSTNGNSNCSGEFLQSIPTMAPSDHIRGSCCSPMNLAHYTEQIDGLKKYAAVEEIPSDPYDIEAGLAQKLLAADAIALTADQQAAYDYAIANAEDRGPCCCQCWRWYVYGGLAKTLISARGFTGAQVTEIWDLSSGCGS